MSNEEAIAIIQNEYKCVDRDCDIERSCGKCDLMMPSKGLILEAYKLAIKALEQQPCEMTTEEYRQRMIQTFHNADTDELIAVCVLPTEKEFEHLEWLLKNHYKKDPCEESEDKQ